MILNIIKYNMLIEYNKEYKKKEYKKKIKYNKNLFLKI